MDTRTDTLHANIPPVDTVAVTFDLSAADRYRRAFADLDATYRRIRALHTQPRLRPIVDPHTFYTDNTIARAVSRHLDGTGDLTDRSIAASLGPDEYRAWVQSVDTCRRALRDA